MPDRQLDDLLQRFEQLEAIEARLNGASPRMAEALQTACDRAGALVLGLSQEPDVQEELKREWDQHVSEVDELEFLKEQGLLGETELTGLQESVDEAAQSPVVRIFRRFVLSAANQDTQPTLATAAELEPVDVVREFFGRPLEVVAEAVAGMKVKVGNKVVTITDVKLLNGADNEKWKDDPLFDKDSPIAMVDHGTGGHYMLFLPAGDETDPTCCVRITGGQTGGGEPLKNSSEVTRHLGITKKSIAAIELDDKTIRLTDVRPFSSAKSKKAIA